MKVAAACEGGSDTETYSPSGVRHNKLLFYIFWGAAIEKMQNAKKWYIYNTAREGVADTQKTTRTGK